MEGTNNDPYDSIQRLQFHVMVIKWRIFFSVEYLANSSHEEAKGSTTRNDTIIKRRQRRLKGWFQCVGYSRAQTSGNVLCLND